MILHKKIILTICLFISYLSLSCSNDADSIRVKNWKILYDQDNSLESVLKKNGWKPIADISNIKTAYPIIKNFQYVWLKGEFNIEKDPGSCYGLTTGKIRFIDKVFINNRIIGSLPTYEVYWRTMPRNYIVYDNIFKKGKNTIAIQLGIYYNESGGISEDVFIQGKEDFNQARFINNLIYIYLPIGIIFIFISHIIEYLIYYLWDRRQKQYIYIILVLITTIVYVLFQPRHLKISHELSHSVMFACPIMISLFVILFYQAFYKIYLSDINRILIPLFLFLALFTIVFNETIYRTLIGYIFVSLTIAIIISAFAFIIYRLNSISRLLSIKPNIFLRRSAIFATSLIGLAIILESYFIIIEKFYPGFVYIYFSPLAIISSANVVSKEIKNRQLELDLLYNKLTAIESEEKDKTISESTEKKLEKIIQFMNENFKSDLSKEGLAAAIDMHPIYMGDLFKTYTGKAIHEYINGLRIEEAIRQLEAGASRIVDIAFAVGFESISTFNRIFKKTTGTTPSEYKVD